MDPGKRDMLSSPSSSSCSSAAAQSSTKDSDKNVGMDQGHNYSHHQYQQQQQQSSLPSLESFLFLPQLPVLEDEEDDSNENFWFPDRHHQYQMKSQKQPVTSARKQPCLSSSLLSTVNSTTIKSSSRVDSPPFTDNCDRSRMSCTKESCSKATSVIPFFHERCEHLPQPSFKSNYSNQVCGSIPDNSLFPFITANDAVTAATSSDNSNKDHKTAPSNVVLSNNKSQQQKLLHSMSFLIKNTSFGNNSSSYNHSASPPLTVANNTFHHHHQEKTQHQPPHSHYRHAVRRKLFFRLCQAFSVLLCMFFLMNLVKNYIWATEYEYKSRAEPFSSALQASSYRPRLQNRLVQSWNMPSMISSSPLLSSSAAIFKIPEILSVPSTGGHNEHDEADDDTKMLNLMLLDVANFTFLMNNKTKCNIPRDDDNYFDSGGGRNADGRTSTNNQGKKGVSNSASTIFFMIIVHSAPRNFEERQAIRETWGSLQRMGQFHIRLVFLLGHKMNPDGNHDGSRNSHKISINNIVADEKGDRMRSGGSKPDHNVFLAEIQRESEIHGDIVSGNFHDSYRNLTYKHLMGYLWVLNHCSNAKYILKADDDAFIDIFQLFEFLLRTFGKDPEPALICNVAVNTKPVRGKNTQGEKWSVTYQEYPYDTYPKYCGGLAYLATPNVIREIYGMSRAMKNKYLWIDDVYVTGILRELAHVEPFYLNLRYSYDPEEYRKWLKKTNEQDKMNEEEDGSSNNIFENKISNNEGKVRGAVTAKPGLSNQMNNEHRPSTPQKIPFMIVHLERGPQLGREMRELWNKTVTVWSASGLV